MLKYYREKGTKDYLVVDTLTKEAYSELGMLRGRGTCIQDDPTSMCTLTIGEQYLKSNCVRVNKKDVPKKYLERF